LEELAMDQTTKHYIQLSEDYERIEQAILFLERNYRSQPGLNEIAESLGLSEYHFQRLFTRWVGISPKRFLQFITKEHAKEMLEASSSILDASYQAGLSGPGRLHDLFVVTEAVTPGEFKNRGEGLTIDYGFHPSPFGECLIATTARGVCYLAFVEDRDYDKALLEVITHWKKAKVKENIVSTRPLAHQIFTFSQKALTEPLHLHLTGTNFQLKVWEALLRIPSGHVVAYEDLARLVGEPNAARAVGAAIGRNPVPVIIPCHRVIQKVGKFGNYRYGAARKKALLGWEMAHEVSEATR
jgi:AraC family transcriptional regulator, regulatory protein of adaptative response / methylated-DNA-[protein]-cysteine methyltransferase